MSETFLGSKILNLFAKSTNLNDSTLKCTFSFIIWKWPFIEFWVCWTKAIIWLIHFSLYELLCFEEISFISVCRMAQKFFSLDIADSNFAFWQEFWGIWAILAAIHYQKLFNKHNYLNLMSNHHVCYFLNDE